MYFCILNLTNMKKHIHLLAMAALLLVVSFTGCVEDYHILVSSQDIRFGLDPGTQTFIIRSDCKWTIEKNEDVDWYTVSPMSGKATDSIVTVKVKGYPNGDYRGASFRVNSPGSVFVSQSVIDFYSMMNKVYGVTSLEHWNTDFYDQIVEDTYNHWEYNPYDTTQGQQMYFLEDGTGIQRNKVIHEEPIYFPFTYEYNPINNTLHIEFETEEGGPESYDPEIICASDSIYRFYHEYKAHWHERADMRKIGVINPTEKTRLLQKLTKRKQGQPIFIQK